MPMFDSHTHRMDAPIGSAIINLPMSLIEHPELFRPDEGRLYSAGIHPLYEGDWEQALHNLQLMAGKPLTGNAVSSSVRCCWPTRQACR